MDQDALLDVYDAHGIFLFPSFYEGAGKASLEAMARGLCTIATETSGMLDYVRDGENGFLVPAGDAEGFAERTRRLLASLPLAEDMSANARATAVPYTWRRCAEGATKFYEHLMAMRTEVAGT